MWGLGPSGNVCPEGHRVVRQGSFGMGLAGGMLATAIVGLVAAAFALGGPHSTGFLFPLLFQLLLLPEAVRLLARGVRWLKIGGPVKSVANQALGAAGAVLFIFGLELLLSLSW